MSSSGLIYAFIVGAWAVYLVPMWLRREDELNKARQTQRYTTAIKVLSHKESFERRYGNVEESGEARELARAIGQGPGPEAGRETLERVKSKAAQERGAAGLRPRPQNRQSPGQARSAATPSATGTTGATAGVTSTAGMTAGASGPRARPAAKRTLAAKSSGPGGRGARTMSVSASVGLSDGATAGPEAAAQTGGRSLLRARRRRVVGALFAVTSLGAIISADLGLRYVWVMLIPSAVLSGYIAWVRKDERARAAERARRHAEAVRAARETHRRETEVQHRREETELRGQEEHAAQLRAEHDEYARRDAAARRRVAAARSRAERRGTQGYADPGDLPKAANS